MIWALLSGLTLLAVIWVLALLWGWPLTIPLAASIALLLGLAVASALRLVLARRRRAELEAQLRRPGSAADHAASPPAQALLELQARLRELASALRRSQGASRWSESPLYASPWYLVLGPPGAGKSTVLQTSGLALKAPGTRAPPSRLATTGCEPWFCDRGVLIDTPGRYAAEYGDHAEWLGLLAALRRVRGRRPLDGIVVVYSLAELVGDRPEQLEDKAKGLRTRLEDLASELGVVLPVYLLLTKADSLPGFGEFHAELPEGASDRVWGATLDSLQERETDCVAAFKAEFDLLKAVLHAHLLERLPAQKRLPEACAQLLRFPLEFESVRAPLAGLVERLFRPSHQREAPVLRGFYFSSSGDSRVGALAVGGPETRFLAHTRMNAAAPRSSFLAELFPEIIFADRSLATRTRRGRLLHHRKQLLLGAAALALGLLGALPALLSCANNFSLIDATLSDLQHSQPVVSSASLTGTSITGTSREALDQLLERFGKLQVVARRFSIRHWWGPYAAAPLRDALQNRYLEQLKGIVHGPVRAALTESIKAASEVRGLDPAGFESAFRDLELYLMLAHPDQLDPQFAASALADTWVRGGGREPATAALTAHVRSYLDTLSRDPSWAWSEDGVVVTRARAQLSSMPIEEIKYAALEQAAAAAPPVLPEHIFVGEAARYVSTRGKVEVPGLYTALGWQKVRPLLKQGLASDLAPWVLGDQFRGASPWGAEQIKKLYFDRYVRAWMDFLVGLDVATPTSLSTAIEELSALDRGEGPYVRLFRRLAENARLELEPAGLEEQARAKATQMITQVATGGPPTPVPPERRVSPVEQHFRRMLRFGFGDAAPTSGVELPPSLLSQYLDQLRALEVSLRQLQDSGIEPSAEFRAELERASGSIERLLAGFDQTERLALEPVLLNPIRGSQRVVEARGRAALTDRWRVEVWEPYRRLVSRYPFVPKSGSDVALPDFAEFFRPQGGTFWRFYDETLANRFLHSGERFVPRPSEMKSGFRSDFLECLSVAQQIGEAVFADGAQQPVVPFKVKMQSVDARVSEITLNLDGETLTYRNEPEKWRALQWPGKNGPAGASLLVKGADFSALVERDEGEFGFLRLLAAGDIKPVSPGSLTLEANWRFRLQGSESRVTIVFQAARRQHPFLPGFFNRLNCPSAITSVPEPR